MLQLPQRAENDTKRKRQGEEDERGGKGKYHKMSGHNDSFMLFILLQ